MADRKYSDDTELAEEPASGDALTVRDVSDTTDAATGTMKKLLWSTLKAVFAVAAKGVTNGDSHDHAGGDGAQVDHGGLAGLADDDHTQYFKDGAQDLAGGGYKLSGFIGDPNTQTDSYETVDGDNGKVIVMNKATGLTLTIHNTAPAGFNCLVIQIGAGQVTIAAEATGAVLNRSTQTKIAGQYGMVSIYVVSNAGTAPQVYLAGDTGA